MQRNSYQLWKTDTVTQISFNSFDGTEIATGAEDGLVCVYDTRQVSKAHNDVEDQ
jgi:hypothetical protein